MNNKEINFNCSKEDAIIIKAIVERAIKECQTIDILSLGMDITACHCNGNPLRLSDLLNADDFDFLHDIFGITMHLNRETRKLENCFVPRFSL